MSEDSGMAWPDEDQGSPYIPDTSYDPYGQDLGPNRDNFIVYTVEKIFDRQKDKISEMVDLLGLTSDQAISVLRFFKWDADKLQQNWFDREAELRKKTGIAFDKALPAKFTYMNASLAAHNKGWCQVCYSNFSTTNCEMHLDCGH